MQYVSKGQIISIILLVFHFLVFAFFGAIFSFVGPMFSSVKPGDELWNAMISQLESRPELMESLASEGHTPESFLIEYAPTIGLYFTIFGSALLVIALFSLLSAIFIYKGKNWAKYLCLVPVFFGMIVPGLILLLSPLGILFLVMGAIIIYMLFFDKETVEAFEKKQPSASTKNLENKTEDKPVEEVKRPFKKTKKQQT
ncbi:MAG: hypothetical protein QXM75_03985 [Candidatus Diapherotrites archaeon]